MTTNRFSLQLFWFCNLLVLIGGEMLFDHFLRPYMGRWVIIVSLLWLGVFLFCVTSRAFYHTMCLFDDFIPIFPRCQKCRRSLLKAKMNSYDEPVPHPDGSYSFRTIKTEYTCQCGIKYVQKKGNNFITKVK